MGRRIFTLAAALMAVLACADSASAAREVSVRYGPIELGPYQVARGDQVFDVPEPKVDGFITKMNATLVYGDGREVPIANTMLHHVVMLDLGSYVGEKQDPACPGGFRMFDSESYLPLKGYRFYGIGEERHELSLPDGYGYPTKTTDRWAMTYMLMNHRKVSEKVYVELRMTVEEQRRLQPVIPVWMDVGGCNLDPVFDVPGGGGKGSTFSRDTTWTAPSAGRLVFGTGHLHGGGKGLRLSQPGCGDRTVFDSKPLWGMPDHPYYRVRPLLHEPGPISMSSFQSAQGIPVAAGERLKLTALYDAERPHVRAMGIMVLAFAPDAGAGTTAPCGAPPGDLRSYWTQDRGRATQPRITVPITALKPGAPRATVVTRSAGPSVRLRGGGTIDVERNAFGPANVSLPAGSSLRWRFFDDELHNVTLANGPRGFSSDNLDGGRSYAYKFSTPGTYRVFCTLHPVGMNETITVR
jgi:plastocyanin